MRMIIDAMGGDNAPEEIVKGAVMAHKQFGYEIILVGDETKVNACLDAENAKDLAGITVHHASEVIGMNDDSTAAIRQKKDSSMVVALNLLKRGEGDAVVSAGSTGALLTGATLLIRRIKGIRRAALAPTLPNAEQGFILIDCGANAECTPEQLMQFAHMGSLYAQRVMGRPSPRVALLNNGTEEHKGTPVHQEAYKILTADDGINFIGNTEGAKALFGGIDVVVADGFSGNVLLKSIEGTAKFLMLSIKDILGKNVKNMVAAALIKKDVYALKDKMDPNKVGGTALLGISKPVIKAHGSSEASAFLSAIRQAGIFAESGFIAEIENNIETMRLSDAQE